MGEGASGHSAGLPPLAARAGRRDAARGRRRCSGLFRSVQGCSGGAGGVDNGVDGVVVGFAVFLGFGVGAGVDSDNFCQPSVNFCQGLVSVGKAEVVRGERHDKDLCSDMSLVGVGGIGVCGYDT